MSRNLKGPNRKLQKLDCLKVMKFKQPNLIFYCLSFGLLLQIKTFSITYFQRIEEEIFSVVSRYETFVEENRQIYYIKLPGHIFYITFTFTLILYFKNRFCFITLYFYVVFIFYALVLK